MHRSNAGLYIFGRSSGFASDAGSYTTYHEDGRYWTRVGDQLFVKKRRQPLTGFKGTLTIQTGLYSNFAAQPHDRDDNAMIVRPEDVVVDFEGSFCMELVLSDGPLTLPPIPERLNAKVFARNNWSPTLTLEAFQTPVPQLVPERFPVTDVWIEGVNLFVNHKGRI